MPQVSIELTRDDYELILMALGYSMGAACNNKDPSGARMCLRAANLFGAAGGNFQPYDVDAEIAALFPVARQTEDLAGEGESVV